MRKGDTILRTPNTQDTDEMEVILVRMSDGQRCRCLPNWKKCYTWEDEYWWTEGNQSCAGNRRDEWAHQRDEVAIDHSCDNQEHYVILRSPGYDGEA